MIPFTKAHACGNDFLIVTEEAAAGFDCAELARFLCARNTGIGADGVEFFAWKDSETGSGSGRVRLHNADGSIAEISGNGTRCVAAWMAEILGSRPGDEFGDCYRCRAARLPRKLDRHRIRICGGSQRRHGSSSDRVSNRRFGKGPAHRWRRGEHRQSALRHRR